VLVVPSSAVKTNSTGSYVEMFDKPLVAVASTTPGVVGTVSLVKPNQIPVEVGISDDTSTEITSGLQPGDQIVSRTITTTTTKTSTTAAAPSLFGSTSTRGFGGGGATRAATGR
jgi:HlyD family secretion protein